MDESVLMDATGFKRDVEHLSGKEQIYEYVNYDHDYSKKRRHVKTPSEENRSELSKKYVPDDLESCRRIHIGLNIRQLCRLVPCCEKIPTSDLLTKTRTFIESLEKEEAENKEQKAVLFKQQRKLKRRLNKLLQECDVKESVSMDAIGCKREVECLSGKEQIIDSKKRKHVKTPSEENRSELSKKYLPDDLESCRRIHIGLNIGQLRGLVPGCEKAPSRLDLLTKTQIFIERLEKEKAENKEQKAVLFKQQRKLKRRLNELLQECDVKESVSMDAIGCKREVECLSGKEQIIDSKKSKCGVM